MIWVTMIVGRLKGVMIFFHSVALSLSSLLEIEDIAPEGYELPEIGRERKCTENSVSFKKGLYFVDWLASSCSEVDESSVATD